jgi:hypothetical protein
VRITPKNIHIFYLSFSSAFDPLINKKGNPSAGWPAQGQQQQTCKYPMMYPNLFSLFRFGLVVGYVCDGCWRINISFLCSAVSAAAAGPCCVNYIARAVCVVLLYSVGRGRFE